MSVDHCRGDLFVSDQLLHGANIVATLQQVGSEAMPEGVATCRFGNPGATNGLQIPANAVEQFWGTSDGSGGRGHVRDGAKTAAA